MCVLGDASNTHLGKPTAIVSSHHIPTVPTCNKALTGNRQDQQLCPHQHRD